MKTKKITSLLLITVQGISLFGAIQFATSCGNADEIIVHAETKQELRKKIAKYLYENNKSSIKILDYLAFKYLPKGTNFVITNFTGSESSYTLSYKYFSDTTRDYTISLSSNIEFIFSKYLREDSTLYSFSIGILMTYDSMR
jgi:hypothetical protein